MSDDPVVAILADSERVAIEPALLGGWIEDESPTPTQERHAQLVAGVLWQAAETLLDDLFADVAELHHLGHHPAQWRDAVSGSRVLSSMPRRFHGRIGPGDANRFAVAAVDLVGRLAHGWRPCACTAQELMLWAWLGYASATVETYDLELEPGWRDHISEALFEDLDFELLFEDSLDGIEDAPELASARLENLRYEHWFTPFGSRRLPPYAERSR